MLPHIVVEGREWPNQSVLLVPPPIHGYQRRILQDLGCPSGRSSR
jgi:hypothetical protein